MSDGHLSGCRKKPLGSARAQSGKTGDGTPTTREAGLSVTKASLRRQRVDFAQRMLMADLHSDAFPLTEENGGTHVLKRDRRLSNGVPPVVGGWQNACNRRLSCRLRQA